MRALRAAALAAALLPCAADLSAHRIDEYLQATLLSVQPHQVQASMRLIPGQLVAPSVVADIYSDGNGVFSESEQRAYAQRVLTDLSISVDATAVVPKLVAWNFPAAARMRDGLGDILIDYTVDLPQFPGERTFSVANRHRFDQSVYLVNVLAPQDAAIRILGQTRDARQSHYALNFRQGDAATTPIAAAGGSGSGSAQSPAQATWWAGLGFASFFELGMHHIAQGTDHLLFLLALLLPAPLAAAGSRWGLPIGVRGSLLRVLAIVTAFTVGHSITLTLAAVDGWTLPARPVEVLIALSILVSSAHALRPLFAGKEAAVAASFGLVHGLAFAATLDRLKVGLWPRVAATLSFNLGIEAMQLLVIAAVLPPLLLMSRAPGYRVVRTGGALVAGLASAAWLAERLLGLEMPIDALAATVARHAPQVAGVFLLVSLGCCFWYRSCRPPGR